MLYIMVYTYTVYYRLLCITVVCVINYEYDC